MVWENIYLCMQLWGWENMHVHLGHCVWENMHVQPGYCVWENMHVHCVTWENLHASYSAYGCDTQTFYTVTFDKNVHKHPDHCTHWIWMTCKDCMHKHTPWSLRDQRTCKWIKSGSEPNLSDMSESNLESAIVQPVSRVYGQQQFN